jgi:predicted AlkP superfamily phosphohydrolase/phosphomutase
MPKVVLIGLDSLIPLWVKKYFRMSKLPNMNKLANEGTWAEIIPVFPTHTASNWNTIATGSWPKTHGVTDMVVHMPGTLLTEVMSGFYSNLCRAEQIWLAAERFGKKSILMKYIGSWPPNMRNGIQVEGFGAPGGPGARPWGSSPLAISNSSCYCTELLQNANLVKISSVNPTDIDNEVLCDIIGNGLSSLRILHTTIMVGPPESLIKYNVFLIYSSNSSAPSNRTGGGENNRVLILRDNADKLGNAILLKKGQVSNWLVENFIFKSRMVKASFRMKLMDIGLSGKGEPMFKLFVSQIFPLEGWTFPHDVASELVTKFGPFLESISHFPYAYKWIDEQTYLDELDYQAKWMSNASRYLLRQKDWDLYMTQWHGVDNTQHAFLRFDKSVLTEHESEISEGVVLKSYEIADEFVGNILSAYSKNSTGRNDRNNNVYTFIISDHGHIIGKRRFFINQYLYQHGLIKLKRDPSKNKITIDWNKTQAFAQGMIYIYVNLKGREPSGIVSTGKEYEDLTDKIIDLLYEIKDPNTGKRVISVALSNKDADFIGLSGERAGDVILALNPPYVFDNRVRISGDLFENLRTGLPDGSIHGQQLPSTDWGEYGSMKSLLIAHGARIKKGQVLGKPVNMVDIAPTIADILEIDPPRNSEGRVIRELFE